MPQKNRNPSNTSRIIKDKHSNSSDNLKGSPRGSRKDIRNLNGKPKITTNLSPRRKTTATDKRRTVTTETMSRAPGTKEIGHSRKRRTDCPRTQGVGSRIARLLRQTIRRPSSCNLWRVRREGRTRRRCRTRVATGVRPTRTYIFPAEYRSLPADCIHNYPSYAPLPI